MMGLEAAFAETNREGRFPGTYRLLTQAILDVEMDSPESPIETI
jgi:hypothetical protein